MLLPFIRYYSCSSILVAQAPTGSQTPSKKDKEEWERENTGTSVASPTQSSSGSSVSQHEVGSFPFNISILFHWCLWRLKTSFEAESRCWSRNCGQFCRFAFFCYQIVSFLGVVPLRVPHWSVSIAAPWILKNSKLFLSRLTIMWTLGRGKRNVRDDIQTVCCIKCTRTSYRHKLSLFCFSQFVYFFPILLLLKSRQKSHESACFKLRRWDSCCRSHGTGTTPLSQRPWLSTTLQ